MLAAEVSASAALFDLEARVEEHWAWRPIHAPPPPATRDETDHVVDRFLLAQLEREQLSPAPPADPGTRLRRLYFDLTGLPPAPDALQAYLVDPTQGAYVQIVDRLLASPQFGERWARHWLDLVRYAETLGHEFDYAIHNAWRYRDYVIRAFNSDLPYDMFVREQIAGDLLSEPRRDPAEGFNESIIGTGFYWLGQQVHSPVDVRAHQAETIENQIDVLSKTFLGLTVACARCHDHKFDAISTRDFYSLYGILSSSRYAQRMIDRPDRYLSGIEQLNERKNEIRVEVARFWLDQVKELSEGDVMALGQSLPETQTASEPAEAVILADFTKPAFGSWRASGHAFGGKPATSADFLVTRSDPPGLKFLTDPAAHSALVSPLLEGSLRSPTFSITNRYLHVRVAGQKARFNVVIDNFTVIRDPIYGGLRRMVNREDLHWITVDLGMWMNHQAYVEFNDMNVGDPGTGPYGLDGYIAISHVVLSPSAAPPPVAQTLAVKNAPVEVKAAVEQMVRDWQNASIDSGQANFLRRLLETRLLTVPESLRARLKEYNDLTFPEPTRVPAMVDGTGLDQPVFIRGNPSQPGPRAHRRFLEALGGSEPYQSGSGRLQFAERLIDHTNPFPARVMVNRVWHHLFGRGLVATPDDFGVLGEEPSHPELLDWLAEWYRTEAGWSTKRLIRLLVTSRAYQMESLRGDARAEQIDPNNRLLHRMPVRRLEGETIRDALLFVSGALDSTMFGPSVAIHLTPFMEGRGRPGESGPLDGNNRRSIYVEVRRNFLSPMLLAFDTPTPLSTIGRRNMSNVPAQALILLNDPFVIQMAQRWAADPLLAGTADHRLRLQFMVRAALGRDPSADELNDMLAFVQAAPNADTAWADVAHVLFNSKEFFFLR